MDTNVLQVWDEIQKETGYKKSDVKNSICSVFVEKLHYSRFELGLHLQAMHKSIVHDDKEVLQKNFPVTSSSYAKT